ncbi:Sphingosine-1-phosphate phosphatase 1 [Sciurus carolinensis]|uniref:Sphingosine-1-phosphate phosphatase 1 n=1 Tax=Sciurus carolinensis TaxID=30640 RepID=A0AA41TCI5_SCICA|nr:Sphingosine-1-phosphate phosphatase 1 [Sciurus carolinensis]
MDSKTIKMCQKFRSHSSFLKKSTNSALRFILKRKKNVIRKEASRLQCVQRGAAAAGQARGRLSLLQIWLAPGSGSTQPGGLPVCRRRRKWPVSSLCAGGGARNRSAKRREDEKAEAPLAGDPLRRGALGRPGATSVSAQTGRSGAPNGVRNRLAAELDLAALPHAGSLRCNSLAGKEGKLAREQLAALLPVLLGHGVGRRTLYIMFFPFWIWNLDALVGCRLVIIWVLVMYLGQCTKDIIRWPPPSSPPVSSWRSSTTPSTACPPGAVSGTPSPFPWSSSPMAAGSILLFVDCFLFPAGVL